MVLKSPVEGKCRETGLQACPELVDGVLLYVDGDRSTALEKLVDGAAQNSPKDIKRFAALLRQLSAAAGSESSAAIVEVAAVLEEAPAAAPKPVAEARLPRKVADEETDELPKAQTETAAPNAVVPSASDLDPARIVTETVAPAADQKRVACELAGIAASCVARREGPMVVLDAIGSPGCEKRVFVAGSRSDVADLGFDWVVPAGYPGIQGARLAVQPEGWLMLVTIEDARTLANGPPCSVTWSGIRTSPLPPGKK